MASINIIQEKDMPAVSIDLEMKRVTNEAFVKTAQACAPTLLEKEIRPVAMVEIKTDANGNAVIQKQAPIAMLDETAMKKGDKICLDFGHHQVGYVSLKLKSVGSPQDAPAYFKVKFGEVANEILEKSEDYDGWISRGWIQEEFIHIDMLPTVLQLPRRYAFRFLEIETIDTSMKWQLVVEDVVCRAVSAVDMAQVADYTMTKETQELAHKAGMDETFVKNLEEASLRTLQNCMQDVFEDGPKRDRRLWLGDLRLQALANYETFQNKELVKRCLYLFAGQTREDGRVSACLFTAPKLIVDDTFFFDYSLFFISVLHDYYANTKDKKTLEELWPCALRQIEIAQQSLNDRQLVVLENENTVFVDWKAGLDKHAAAQAIFIYCMKQATTLAEILGKKEQAEGLFTKTKKLTAAAKEAYWDEAEGLFVSGDERQISYASQAWMVLAEVVSKEQAQAILKKVAQYEPDMGMVTPYMNHHYVESMIKCGMKQEALAFMKYYWGGMLEQDADTFWELYNPKNPKESPYGSSIVNSYCHAWSCTPTYLLRKYFSKRGE